MQREKKVLAAVAMKVRLALASGVVLLVGSLIAPRAEPTNLKTPQELVAPLLGEQAQVRDLPQPFQGVQSVTPKVRDRVVAIPPLASRVPSSRSDFLEAPESLAAAGFGVFVSDRHVLTHAVALDGRTTLELSLSDGTLVNAEVVAYEPSTELVLLQTTASGQSAAPLAKELPNAGALGVGVGRWRRVDMAVPVFVISGGRPLAIEADRAVLPGMPLYNLEGELFAIAAGMERGAAFAAAEAVTRLMARASANRRLASFGLGLQDLTDSLRPAFGEKGVLVTDVIEGGPAARAGIEVGDLLVAIGAMDIDSADAAARTIGDTQIDSATKVTVVRSGRDRTIDVTAIPAYTVAAMARSRGAPADAGREARDLFPAAVLERAGIPPTAFAITVDGREMTSRSQVERILRASRRPVAVLLRHEGNQFFAAIEAAR